jgi:hypothetical protein
VKRNVCGLAASSEGHRCVDVLEGHVNGLIAYGADACFHIKNYIAASAVPPRSSSSRQHRLHTERESHPQPRAHQQKHPYCTSTGTTTAPVLVLQVLYYHYR